MTSASSMKPIGKIPTPYGQKIDVYFDRSRSINEEDCYFHTMDDCMTIAGVHGKRNRAACWSELQKSSKSGAVQFEIFLKYGGRKMVYATLPRPETSIYELLPDVKGIKDIAENWVTLTMDQKDWFDRSATLLEVCIAGSLEQAKTFSIPVNLADTTIGISLGFLITIALEHLAETEVSSLEAAAFYALSEHVGWRKAALEWLSPIKDTWFADWKRERPVYRRLARVRRKIHRDIPAWVGGADND